MYNLQSTIVVRLFECVGAITRDTGIISDKYKYLTNQNIFSGIVNITNDFNIQCVVKIIGNDHFMILKSNESTNTNLFCFVCMDAECVIPELNKGFCILSEKDKILELRELSNLELVNILRGFETIKEYIQSWSIYKYSDKDLDLMSKLINTIEFEEEDGEKE